jgi:glycopeptide antibiotics resistance protein
VKRFRVGKVVQGLLLGTCTAVVLALTLLVQGRPGVRTNLAPFEDLQRLSALASRRGMLSNVFLFAVAGIAGNLVMFAVWAYLAWKFLDGKGRSPWRNDVDVLVAGTLFSAGIEAVQLFLPTRAADINDVFWNVLGTVAGLLLAHLGTIVQLDWE